MNKILKFVALFSLLGFAIGSFAKDITLVDITGRSVTVPQGTKKVILAEGRMAYAIASLFGKEGNMFNHIISMKNDLKLYDPDAYRKFLAKFSQIKDIPQFGSGDLNVEHAISVGAEVVLFNLGEYFKIKGTNTIDKFNKAGIATVFIDFRQSPMQNTIPSLLILGKVFGKEKEALNVVDFYVSQKQKVFGRIANKKDNEKPIVLIENAAAGGWGDCCLSFGDTSMGRFVSFAGGVNLATKLLGSGKGKLNPEFIFKEDPDIIIGTGANWSEAKPTTKAVLLGYEADAKDVKKRIAYLANRKGWGELKAVKNKRFYSIYHQFYNSPYNFVALQHFAKAFYPQDFKDLNPTEIFIEFHDKFLPIDYSGQFWGELK